MSGETERERERERGEIRAQNSLFYMTASASVQGLMEGR